VNQRHTRGRYWTTGSLRSWNEPRRSTSRSICTRPYRQRRCRGVVRWFSRRHRRVAGQAGLAHRNRGPLIRMILGVCSTLSEAQVVVGHLGERHSVHVAETQQELPTSDEAQSSVGAYLRENVHYTSAASIFRRRSSTCCWRLAWDGYVLGDHPYGSMAEARAFLQQLPASEADRERIGTATRRSCGFVMRVRTNGQILVEDAPPPERQSRLPWPPGGVHEALLWA